ncbi:hypothetical protein [Nostoc favosum]|uniref:Uncharacterized protein n=1 Tax=Nostoc favosum CHAB5714 TaxID=2780399 RepID=A0ABS8IAP5_9NOSO|nr:hypothetical protein [Nostoc favosum]MCC5601270.1 hypothetical protein [Nostoc favosum CHAB5714]
MTKSAGGYPGHPLKGWDSRRFSLKTISVFPALYPATDSEYRMSVGDLRRIS